MSSLRSIRAARIPRVCGARVAERGYVPVSCTYRITVAQPNWKNYKQIRVCLLLIDLSLGCGLLVAIRGGEEALMGGREGAKRIV